MFLLKIGLDLRKRLEKYWVIFAISYFSLMYNHFVLRNLFLKKEQRLLNVGLGCLPLENIFLKDVSQYDT
jgi:hypothetical protein